jgi:hypothetical protein
MIQHFWDEEAGIFWAIKEGSPLKVRTPFNLYPLWTGLLPEKMNNRLIEHLKDPRSFWGDYPIPTVARDDQPLIHKICGGSRLGKHQLLFH